MGSINLKTGSKVPAANLFQNASGMNLSVLNTIFTAALSFDSGGNLAGLGLIKTDLASLDISGGKLTL